MNRNLGNYDMVLSLSSSKINYQFKKMYQRKIIHSDWAFLTNSMGKEVKAMTNEEAKNYWQGLDKNKLDFEAKKANLQSINQQIAAEMDKDEWDQNKLRGLQNQRKSVKAEVDALQAKVDEANLYDLGLIATIAEPKIEILSETSKELIFQISFKPGSTLFYTREGKKAEYDLGGNGIKYAFRVSIGKIKITSDKKIVDIDENGKEQEKTLRDKGINDNDFTIQALFLDFENANIANYDSKSSTLPEAAGDNALLQAAMVNYFKSLANSDNPYVLGYGIQKNEVQEGERGLFYPTGVAYSTSHSREQRASTFNFLMLLNNHPFPSGNDSGVLPISLMEHAQDTTATVNGVFGLNMSEFENTYIPLLSNSLIEKIRKNLTTDQKVKLTNSGLHEERSLFFEYSREGSSCKLNINYVGIQESQDRRGVDISYEITASAKAYQELHGPIHIGNIDADWDLSTSGKEVPEGAKNVRKGQVGSVIITLKAGASGNLEIATKHTDPILGFDSQKPKIRNKANEYLLKIFNILKWVVLIVVVADELSDLISPTKVGISGIDFGNILNIEDIGKLENRVILPVASVYTYKNIRILGKATDPDSVLLFDTSYATVAQ